MIQDPYIVIMKNATVLVYVNITNICHHGL